MKGYVNTCGKLNLKTGNNAHFNVLRDWSPKDTHIVLFRMKPDYWRSMPAEAVYRAVGGHGEYEVGEGVELLTSTHRKIGFGVAELCVPCDAAGLIKLKEKLGKNSVNFGTWD